MQLALASGEEAREHVTIYLSEDDYERERELLEGLREFTASLQLKLLPDGPLPLLAANIVQERCGQPAAGPLPVEAASCNVSFAPWRYAAVLALVFLVVAPRPEVVAVLPLSRARKRASTRRSAEVYQQLMPGAPLPDASAARAQGRSSA